MADHVERLVDSFLQHELMNETAAYLGGGRVYRAMPTEEIEGRWVDAFRSTYKEPDALNSRNMDDLGAELRLRELEPPYDKVAPEIEAFRQELIERGPGSTPEVRKKIGAFLKARDEPSS